MLKKILKHSLFALLGLATSTPHAATPVWVFETIPEYPPSISLSRNDTAIILYYVTNLSHKTHTLVMKPIQGISASNCAKPLGYLEYCLLVLTVEGSALSGNVVGGPILCEHGNPLQCYQPAPTNVLNIQLTSLITDSKEHV